jgi:hypothetical protein
MNVFRQLLALMIALLGAMPLSGQQTKRVLFLGNSYTYFNNMPQILTNMAASTGKTLVYDMNAPGGYYIGQHVTNPVSLAKIAVGNWDHVVLQDQSMALAYTSTYTNSISYSIKIDSIIKADNPCSQTMFYSTWGRKNGDTYLCSPPECATNTYITRSYYQMDSTITSHYKLFADSAKAGVTPVGPVWRYLRLNHPTIELFDPDDSHPSPAGSYAVACSFYATIFRSDPTLISYNAGMTAADAAAIRNAVKQIVYNQLPQWNVGPYDPLLDQSCLQTGLEDGQQLASPRVYPNPVTDELYVTFPAGRTKDVIRIYNLLGNLVKEVELTAGSPVSMRELPEGFYLLRFGNDSHTVKVIKR